MFTCSIITLACSALIGFNIAFTLIGLPHYAAPTKAAPAKLGRRS